MFLVSPYAHPPGTMYSAIQRIGLTSNLQICLDAGDINSYDGTSQTWTDVSGNGYSFFRGATNGSESTDPTFNGTAGRQSSAEYFSFDGGDYLTLGQANPSFIDSMHKADALFTVTALIYIASIGTGQVIMGDYSSTAGDFAVAVSVAGNLGLYVNSATAGVYQGVTSATVSTGAWHFVTVQVNEALTTGIFQIDGTQESMTVSYDDSPPSSGPAGNIVKIGADGDAAKPFLSGGRIAGLALWNRALSSSELTSLYSSLKSKYGLL